ncbi:hypothetical protein L218DRAFT_959518 [Marasmius fiardii PR-910]|nr:hypothetical protein L218DRAFT_959518 [Marasmius fiardii PR-910]
MSIRMLVGLYSMPTSHSHQHSIHTSTSVSIMIGLDVFASVGRGNRLSSEPIDFSVPERIS